ncbi:hypothetical protein E3P81_03798 [Wallemia ichthyophaga]|nr:hypothetical protein E3P97_03775 [Wallemia ichthyophaga]TIB01687.1 hypothetical protein E3P96_02328 [Wallemia ichthyophaga]TIB28304.1 hypothetical protein E3P85_03733 [Wallemia ichthyophaga]TIB43920.1 hypothetical protein E3P82_03772 [Wallemia ichthyophaga]TIB46116.1 hypothetical protein E3P81_03798 [Wallemia ichthyophaga]
MPGAFSRSPSNASFAGRPSPAKPSLGSNLNRRPGGGGKWIDGQHIPAPRNDKMEIDLFGEPGDPLNSSTGINFEKYAAIPVEAKGHGVPDPITEFTNPPIDPHLIENIRFARYTTPTPVQKYSVPIVGSGRDLMACAQTGSGKTGGFLFPILSACFSNGPSQVQPPNPPKYGGTKVYPTALILAPTRELVNQIHEEAKKFAYRSWVKPAVVYGGAPSGEQMRQLDRGCDLLSAAPGRLCDFIDRGKISLANVKYLVLDEADRMLDMGFEPQIRKIVQGCDMPTVHDRQTLLFSATFPREIQMLARDFLKDEVFLSVGRVGSTSENITQTVEWAEDFEKKSVLLDILEGHMEPDGNNRTLIFVETKRMADILCDFLLQNSLRATAIHGDRDQREREYALSTFKKGTNPMMVATAVAARGLDIPHVSLVVNYDLPSDIDDYVHRIGRTGRAEACLRFSKKLSRRYLIGLRVVCNKPVCLVEEVEAEEDLEEEEECHLEAVACLQEGLDHHLEELMDLRCYRNTSTMARNSSSEFNALTEPPHPNKTKTQFNSIDEAIEAYKRGEFVIVMDDQDRENEGDLVLPACGVTAEQMAWMIKWTSGYICISLPSARLSELQIGMMSSENTEKHKTAYTVTVDYLKGVSTGISATDRALTARMLSPGSGASANDFNRPGHMVPLRCVDGGTVNRQGHTESATDLAILAHLPPAGLLCEIVNPHSPHGDMARLTDCMAFAAIWGIPVITVNMIAERMSSRYHAWMASEEMRTLTASEPLSLDGEYAMQRSWHIDDDKLAFIVVDSSVGDYDTLPGEERERHGKPIGDVNIFLNMGDDDVPLAECEVMIADKNYRGKGIGREAMMLMLSYYKHHVDEHNERILSVKISYKNIPSYSLFRNLFFAEHKHVDIFEEVELRHCSYVAEPISLINYA